MSLVTRRCVLNSVVCLQCNLSRSDHLDKIVQSARLNLCKTNDCFSRSLHETFQLESSMRSQNALFTTKAAMNSILFLTVVQVKLFKVSWSMEIQFRLFLEWDIELFFSMATNLKLICPYHAISPSVLRECAPEIHAEDWWNLSTSILKLNTKLKTCICINKSLCNIMCTFTYKLWNWISSKKIFSKTINFSWNHFLSKKGMIWPPPPGASTLLSYPL